MAISDVVSPLVHQCVGSAGNYTKTNSKFFSSHIDASILNGIAQCQLQSIQRTSRNTIYSNKLLKMSNIETKPTFRN